MKALIAALLLLVLIGGVTLNSSASEPDKEVKVPAGMGPAIDVALEEFARTRRKLESYEIVVSEEGKRIVVWFRDPDFLPTALGTSPGLPDYVVEIESENLEVVKAYSSR